MIRNIVGVVCGVVGWGIVFNALWYGLSIARSGTFNEDLTTQDPVNLGVMLLVSFFVSLAMGWVCALIARNRKTVLALAIFNLLIGVGVQAGSWGEFPVWYHVPFLIGVVPFTVLGGRLVRKS